MRVALIHYWIVTWRGGEQVLKAIAALYPQADIYTHVADPKILEAELPGRRVVPTFVSKLPLASRLYQKYLPLMPMALEHLNLQEYDLVISSESGPAKGVLVSPKATHVCYCHSPMRYVWDRYHDYVGQMSVFGRAAAVPLLHYMRVWDQVSAQRVDHFVANSRFVSNRIEKFYRRSAEVIHPPVPVGKFDASREAEDFYLWVGQLVSYKRPDLLVEAFNRLGRALIVIGEGPMLEKLRRIAKRNIQFLGRQSSDVIVDRYARCRAVVFPGVEDFGIVPVEAMASGKPVIAFGYGGLLETVLDGITGVMFREPTVESLVDAVVRFEQRQSFDSRTIRAHAEQFSEEAFRSKFSSFTAKIMRSGPALGEAI